MKYLLFDKSAIVSYVADTQLQSIEYSDGRKLVDHVCGELCSEIFHNTIIEYSKDGVMFVGMNRAKDDAGKGVRIFCIDLTQCNILSEKNNPARLLTLIQKTFRLVLKIWDRRPFSISERVSGSKSILFPFSQPDHNRIVIERSNNILRLTNRGIDFPLLAYKYNAEDPSLAGDDIDTTILKKAGEGYAGSYRTILKKYEPADLPGAEQKEKALETVESNPVQERSDFIFLGIDRQYQMLTDTQRAIVDFNQFGVPLRIEGAAGTGKTISMIMRAYKILSEKEKEGKPFRIAFLAHSESTSSRNLGVFSLYENSNRFLDGCHEQTIRFETLLSFCKSFARVSDNMLLESDALESKNYQLMLIQDVVERATETKKIKTYSPIISQEIRELFDSDKTQPQALMNMLQHEFSVQIKGRTDCSIDGYYEIPSIPNGVPCSTKADKELIFSLFLDYQKELLESGSYDVDDVTIEALSRLNAPIWRRERNTAGYDYIFADEMHLFNINEQSVFHFLTKDPAIKEIPICFALDYAQSIGDRGNTSSDYISKEAFGIAESKKLKTVFRNSRPITELCAAIAASGTLMFGSSFANPYDIPQYGFTNMEEEKSITPKLIMCDNDDLILDTLDSVISEYIKDLHCKLCDIAIVSFDEKWLSSEGIKLLEERLGKKLNVLDRSDTKDDNAIVISSPYAINGLEFQGIILVGVDEGRVPQTSGTSDISKHYIMYSAYNMLYLSISRAKYRVVMLGSKLNGISSCLEHAISNKYLDVL